MEEAIGSAVEEAVERAMSRAVAPLLQELARLRAENDGQITIDEAAARLGKTKRHVQRCLQDGRLEPVQAGGVRMVRWPPRSAPG
jgi:excisionase family DNA binding protein